VKSQCKYFLSPAKAQTQLFFVLPQEQAKNTLDEHNLRIFMLYDSVFLMIEISTLS